MLFDGGFSFSNFLVDLVTIFAFVVWFWLLILIFSDLFRRTDIPGWGKALWVILVIFTSYIGVLVYLITQGRGMARRNAEQAQAARITPTSPARHGSTRSFHAVARWRSSFILPLRISAN